MTSQKTLAASVYVCLLAFLVLVAPLQAVSTYKVLHTFGPLPDGALPTAGLVLDSLPAQRWGINEKRSQLPHRCLERSRR